MPFFLAFVLMLERQRERERVGLVLLDHLSVPWSLRPRNRAAAATCGRGRCDFPAI